MNETTASRRLSAAVVIPVFNRERHLPAMIDSLEHQIRRPDEVIFVDNGSTDSSGAILNAAARRLNAEGWNVSVIDEPRKGAARARATGVNASESDIIFCFDSDDLMNPEYLAKGIEPFESDPDIDVSIWNYTFRISDNSSWQRKIPKRDILENHLVRGLLSTQSYAVRKSYLDAVGNWDPAIGGWDDYELGLRLLLGGGRLLFRNESRCIVNLHAESITGDNYLHRKGDWEKTLDKMTATADTVADPGLRLYLLRMLAYRRAILAAHYRREGDAAAARELLSSALRSDATDMPTRILLRGAYTLTRLAGRGSGLIFPPLIRRLK